MMIKIIIFLFTISVLMVTSTHVVFAGGPKWDYDERYADIPGAPEC